MILGNIATLLLACLMYSFYMSGTFAMSSKPDLFDDPKVDALRITIQKGDCEAVRLMLE